MKLITNPKKIKEDKSSFSPFANARVIDEVLTRGVVEILPSKEGLARLMKRQRIRLYLGIDPTAPKLHLGHTITLRKLQEFAALGHEAILVIGTGTVLAGDPSARDKARTLITEGEIKRNIKDWKKQAGKVLDFSKVKIRYNGDWLLKLKLKDIIQIACHISAIKLFQRDMFQERLKKGGTVWTHETLYPLLQGYDSVALNTDLEIGGTDQLFNMLIGRELLEKMKNKEKYTLTVPLVLGIDGKPMSKSSGNCVWLTDSASQMFGKIMSIPDELIGDYLELLTRVPTEEVKKGNPRDLKAKLAKEIVKIYHGERAAKKAEEEFNKVFREKGLPSKIPVFETSKKVYLLLDLLFDAKLVPSKSEARRVILQGGVKIDGEVKKDWKEKVEPKNGWVLQVGKRKFLKISVK